MGAERLLRRSHRRGILDAAVELGSVLCWPGNVEEAERLLLGEGSSQVLIGNGDLECGPLGRAEILYRPGT